MSSSVDKPCKKILILGTDTHVDVRSFAHVEAALLEHFDARVVRWVQGCEECRTASVGESESRLCRVILELRSERHLMSAIDINFPCGRDIRFIVQSESLAERSPLSMSATQRSPGQSRKHSRKEWRRGHDAQKDITISGGREEEDPRDMVVSGGKEEEGGDEEDPRDMGGDANGEERGGGVEESSDVGGDTNGEERGGDEENAKDMKGYRGVKERFGVEQDPRDMGGDANGEGLGEDEENARDTRGSRDVKERSGCEEEPRDIGGRAERLSMPGCSEGPGRDQRHQLREERVAGETCGGAALDAHVQHRGGSNGEAILEAFQSSWFYGGQGWSTLAWGGGAIGILGGALVWMRWTRGRQ